MGLSSELSTQRVNANLPADARAAIMNARGKERVYKERKDKGVKRGRYMTKARREALNDMLFRLGGDQDVHVAQHPSAS